MKQVKPININKLLLDVDNPRFPTPAENQRDAIAKMRWAVRSAMSVKQTLSD